MRGIGVDLFAFLSGLVSTRTIDVMWETCESCHRGHKPSVDFCAQCHDFGFTVP
jgi:hypothetical protein